MVIKRRKRGRGHSRRGVWFLAFLTGCATAFPTDQTYQTAVLRTTPLARPAAAGACGIQLASFNVGPTADSPPAPVAVATAAPLSGRKELSVEGLLAQVLARNPSLAQMTAAWQAASARYPQVVSLDDPMLAVTLGPATYGANSVNPAYRINLEQKYSWPGKRRLRGEQANAEAGAAENDLEDARLQLIE